MNIIGHKYIFLTISGILVLISLFAIFVWGLKLGIDFTGGSLLEVEFKDQRPETAEIQKILEKSDLGNVVIQFTGERGVILRFRHVDELTHQQILKALGAGSGERGAATAEKRFNSIGPTIGRDLKQKSILALLLAVVGIVLYIAFAFRKVSKPVSSWNYGIAAILALVHDVVIPTGVFAALGHFKGVEVDTLFITALLTILGFSVHDTIVVFDRVRENLHKLKTPEPYEIMVNRSVNETIARSINTSLTVLLVLLIIMFLGGETTKFFALALIMGITFGTYSSIFVASPLLVIWQNLTKRT